MEQELLELWSSVEKDKDARRQLAHATLVARQHHRARARLPKQVGSSTDQTCAAVSWELEALLRSRIVASCQAAMDASLPSSRVHGTD